VSLEVDLSEFRSAYLAEMEELAIAAESAIAKLDAADSTPSGVRARGPIRDLLRAVHTMKGLSAMMNAEPIVELAHDLEELLRAIDGGSVPLDPKRLSLVVETLRGILERAAAMREGHAPSPAPRAWIEGLRASAAGEAQASIDAVPKTQSAPPRESVAGFDKLEPDERELLERVRPGARAVRVTFAPSPEKAAAGHTIARVRERLADVMELVRVVPLSAGVSSNAGGLTFALFGIATSADDVLAAAAGYGAGEALAVVTTLFDGTAIADGGHRAADLLLAAGGDALALPEPSLSSRSSSHLRVEPRRVDDAIDRVSAMLVTRSRLTLALAKMTERGVDTREMAGILHDSARQLRDARGALMRLRMIPTSELTDRMPLVLKDLRRTSPKLARFEASGTHVELDKAVADRVFPALVHLVRNAFDHGVEEPAEREALGKPAEGCITAAFRSTSNGRIELRLSDDGRGIDRPSVLAAAGGAGAGSDADLLALLCRPGLSTKAEASRASGRGMGMDIARKIIVDELGGSLSLETTPREGTTFVVDLPLTIAVVDAFKIRVAAEVFVVAVAVVDEIVELDPAAIVALPTSTGPRLMRHRTGTLALFEVADLLGFPRADAPPDGERGARQALIVRKSGEPVALAIDRVFGQVETVVRPLEDLLVRVPCVSGSTDLGDGMPRLVLDLVALAGVASAKRGAPSAPAGAPKGAHPS